MCPKQRHSTPDSAWRISSSVAFGLLIEQRLGREDDAAQAEAALRRLLVDERLLDRMRTLGRAEPFERGDLGAGYGLHRRHARPDRLAVHDHGAGAALAEPAAELRAAQRQIVAEHVEERRRRVGIERVTAAVDAKCDQALVVSREKALVLRSLKELEFDHAMRKVSDGDFAEIGLRLRARAIELMRELDRATSAEVRAEPAPTVPPAAPAGPFVVAAPTPAGPFAELRVEEMTPAACTVCGTENDADARFCKNCGTRVRMRAWRANCLASLTLASAMLVVAAPVTAVAQVMPNPRQMSGIPLPSSDLPTGTISVRVIRGTFANNVSGVPVEFTAGGRTTTVATDSSGRAQTSGWAAGSRVIVRTVVDGERSVARDHRRRWRCPDHATSAAPGSTTAAPGAPAGPAPSVTPVPSVLGQSRLVIDFVDDRLRVFYVMDVVNGAAGPVDIGGPLIFDLPRTARGVSLLEGTTKQATANGPRVTVVGPFAPGSTSVSFGYELPHRWSDCAHGAGVAREPSGPAGDRAQDGGAGPRVAAAAVEGITHSRGSAARRG